MIKIHVGMMVRINDTARPSSDRGEIARVTHVQPAEVRKGQQWVRLDGQGLEWSGYWTEELEIPTLEEVTLWLLAQ